MLRVPVVKFAFVVLAVLASIRGPAATLRADAEPTKAPESMVFDEQEERSSFLKTAYVPDEADSDWDLLENPLDLALGQTPDAWITASFDTPFWKSWDGSIELGLNGTEGNSETFNLRMGAKVRRESEATIQKIEFTHIDKSNQGAQTALSTLLDGRQEWKLRDERYTYFVHGLMEYDEFKAFDVRLSADTGLSRKLINTDTKRLSGRLGASASREVGGPNDEWIPELLFGVDYDHKIDDRQKVTFEATYYPDITDYENFRLNSKASWEIVVNPDWGMSLKLSAIDRYDSTPSGAKPNDLDYSLLMLWNF